MAAAKYTNLSEMLKKYIYLYFSLYLVSISDGSTV